MKKTLFVFILLTALTSCVSKKKYLEATDRLKATETALNQAQAQAERCALEKEALEKEIENLKKLLKEREATGNTKETEIATLKTKINSLEQQLEYFKATNTTLLARLEDLSVLSKTGAESIKKSLETLNMQNKYIKDLTSSIQTKDSLNLSLVMNLKRSLDDINDEDVKVEVKKGVVYISISDKMLFKSGSADINPQAETVLGKIAKVVNDHKELDILVEGHTDNVPISNSCMSDNWDLSAKRATSVVRMLQKKYSVAPERMTAGGRSEYVPKATNATADGRKVNRRTEIIILPKLDQFFKLLETPTNQ